MLELNEKVKPGKDGILQEAVGLAEDVTYVNLVEADLSESKGKGRHIGVIEGVAAKADIVNRNGRYYSKEVFEIAVREAQGLIKRGRFLGEVDHPWMGSLTGAAYRFTKLFMDGDLVKFEGVILDTPTGQILKALLEGGVGVAVSTRGYGTARKELVKVGDSEIEAQVINTDFRLEGIDFVLFPSNPYGEVTHHEQDQSRYKQEAPEMDIETLRREHPELVAEIEKQAREGYVAQADHEAALEAARQEGREEALESEEVTSRQNVIAAVVEALRPVVPELAAVAQEAEQTEAERELAAVREQLEALTGRLEAVEEERNQLQREQEEREVREAVTARVNELLESFAHADLIRDELLALESVEAVESAFEAKSALIESLATRLGINPGEKGTGIAESKTGNEETPQDVADDIEAIWESYI